MRNRSNWLPTKFVSHNGRLRATSDTSELNASSWLVADLVANEYDHALKTHASGRLLDMGCGKAPLFGAYSSYVTDVQCIDWARTKHGFDYLDQVCDLTTSIPYDDGSFETIILSDVLEHLPEPMICWKEMNRLLAAGGKVLLNVPFYYPLHEEPYDFYRYTEFALRRFAECNSFEVAELRPIGGPIEILADLIGKMLAGARLPSAAKGVQMAAGYLGRSRIGCRISARTNARFPLGYFMVAIKNQAAAQPAQSVQGRSAINSTGNGENTPGESRMSRRIWR